MKSLKESMLLYAVTDRTWTSRQSLIKQVEEALKGGITFLQLREKELDYESFFKEAMEIKLLCNRHQIPFVINDNIEIAIACDADGVHVGQSDLQAGKARLKLGPNKILGVSVQTPAQAILAEEQGADYLGVGAVFTTTTKADADTVSLKTLKEICNAVTIPVIAIGGIDAHNVLELSGSNIDGIAVVSAIFAQGDIKKATETLLQLTDRMVKGDRRC